MHQYMTEPMSIPRTGPDDASHDHEDILYPEAGPFVLLHLAAFAAIWTGVTWQSVVICVVLYFLRIFAIGAGYHRYFAHRAYSTSRVFQFILAFLSQSTAQKSTLWWAAKHRHHHQHSDTEQDVHSPRHRGFVYAHLGWIFSTRHRTTDLSKIADFARYPELMLLHKYELTPAVILAAITFLIGGWPGLVVGFVWSTVLVYHGTFCINSLAHVHGRKRYVTGDDSRNNWLLALVTMGEGWHNNHHAYQSSVRQGFRWWEVDPTFYILKALSWCGVVWNLKTPPEAVLRNEQRLGTKIIERAAAELAGSFHIERIAVLPLEAHPELIVDPDAVLPGPVAFEGFEPVGRRDTQVVKPAGAIEHRQLAHGDGFDVDPALHAVTGKQLGSLGVAEALDHGDDRNEWCY